MSRLALHNRDTVSVQQVIDTYHKLLTGGLKHWTFISHSSGGWKSNINVPVDLVSGESMLPGLQMTVYFLYPHIVRARERESESELLYLL